jgi:cytochrome c biogenesis protein CcdA
VSWIDIWTAFWLGILTSISPCPLATNIAAISYIGKDISSHFTVLISGTSYTLGRISAYISIGILLSAGLSSVPEIKTVK